MLVREMDQVGHPKALPNIYLRLLHSNATRSSQTTYGARSPTNNFYYPYYFA